MKNIQFFALLTIVSGITFFNSKIIAQNAADHAAVLKMWHAAWHAFENDEPAIWSFYAPDACEIYPDGSVLVGLENIRAGYEAFKGLLDGKASWAYSEPAIQFITSDVALATAKITTDIKIKEVGQVGGEAQFAAVLRRTPNGHWQFVFDSQTPILPPPPATSGK